MAIPCVPTQGFSQSRQAIAGIGKGAALCGYTVRVISEPHVDETIESIAELERRALADSSHHQRAIERLSQGIGRPATLYLTATAVILWVGLNLAALGMHVAPLDRPPFSGLSTAVSVASLLTAIMILVAANRGDALDEQRERLALQIALLTDRKTAKIIALLEELRRDSPAVPDRHDAEAHALSKVTDPHAVAAELEKRTPSVGAPPE
jgi:uncharacterized membrane protein